MFRYSWNPQNPFSTQQFEWDVEPHPSKIKIKLDRTQQILVKQKHDLGFSWSLNPYRGCTHACAYCYARDYHHYLEFGAGTDFERTILVKTQAPELLQATFERRSWRGERIFFSSATDCYQPIERKFEITKKLLAICAKYRNPVTILTRSPLILRDLEWLQQLNQVQAVTVTLSIPLSDRTLCQALEPGAPPPSARIRALEHLSYAGIPVGVSLAPVIPGLSEPMIPNILQKVRQAGAQWAWMGPIRLSKTVKEVFQRRLKDVLPERASKVIRAIQEHEVNPSNPNWQVTKKLFLIWHQKLQFQSPPEPPPISPFRRPSSQLSLFSEKTILNENDKG